MISLRPLAPSDASPEYLSWLNDDEVNRYSRRLGRRETMDGLRSWLEQDAPDIRMAILLDGRHVGGVSLSADAELSIMLGDRTVWGRGIGREAISLMTRHGFGLGLQRIWAESPNPAFNRAVARLGWRHEGIKPAALRGMDLECWAT